MVRFHLTWVNFGKFYCRKNFHQIFYKILILPCSVWGILLMKSLTQQLGFYHFILIIFFPLKFSIFNNLLNKKTLRENETAWSIRVSYDRIRRRSGQARILYCIWSLVSSSKNRSLKSILHYIYRIIAELQFISKVFLYYFKLI